jgi:hypothetical protein
MAALGPASSMVHKWVTEILSEMPTVESCPVLLANVFYWVSDTMNVVKVNGKQHYFLQRPVGRN